MVDCGYLTWLAYLVGSPGDYTMVTLPSLAYLIGLSGHFTGLTHLFISLCQLIWQRTWLVYLITFRGYVTWLLCLVIYPY